MRVEKARKLYLSKECNNTDLKKFNLYESLSDETREQIDTWIERVVDDVRNMGYISAFDLVMTLCMHIAERMVVFDKDQALKKKSRRLREKYNKERP